MSQSQAIKRNEKFKKQNDRNFNNKNSEFKSLSLMAKFDLDNTEKLSPMLTRCRLYIMYVDGNRNGSYISKNVVDDALYSLKLCPIIGEYSDELQGFKSHGGKIVIDENTNEIEYIDTTRPYGTTGENLNTYYEMVTEKDGSEHEYLVCDDIYLWTGRYPYLLDSIDKETWHSMEIFNIEGKKDEKDGLYHISSFVFGGLCLLGRDDDNNGDNDRNFEPCFESSHIEEYSFNKDKFKQEFSLMVSELKETLLTNNTQLNNQILPITDNELKYNSNSVNINTNTKNENIKEEIDSMAKEIKSFSLLNEQLESEIRRVLSTAKYECEDWWGDHYECTRFYLEDYDESFVYVYDCMKGYIDVKLPYTKNGDDIVIDFKNITRFKWSPVDWEGAEKVTNENGEEVDVETYSSKAIKEIVTNFENVAKAKFNKIQEEFNAKSNSEANTEKFDDLTSKVSDYEAKIAEFEKTISDKDTELNTIKSDFAKAQEENVQLKDYQLNKEKEEKQSSIDALFADEKFALIVNEESVKSLKEKAMEMEFSEVETKLFALLGKSVASNPSKFSLQKDSNFKI